jgi:hypothetical protein
VQPNNRTGHSRGNLGHGSASPYLFNDNLTPTDVVANELGYPGGMRVERPSSVRADGLERQERLGAPGGWPGSDHFTK